MGTPPAKITEAKVVKTEKAVKAQPIPKKLTCYVMPDKPDKPGLMIVSTTRTFGDCYVLEWRQQSTTLITSEAPQWYAYTSKILKANLAFTAVFAVGLLIVLFLNRRV
jgi:hypothetical protein